MWLLDLHKPWLSERRFFGPNPKCDYYDTELQYVAEQLDRLFETLERRGEYDETMIVLTGDHGDIFREYPRLPWSRLGAFARKIPMLRRPLISDGYLGHLGRPFFEEVVHVPLFVKLPSNDESGTEVTGQVELLDVLPTIIDVADRQPPSRIEGETLLPRIRDDGGGKEVVRAEMEPNPVDGLTRMVRGPEYKYMTFESPGIHDVTTLSGVPTFTGRRLLTPDEVATDRTQEPVNIVSGDVPEVERLKEAMES
jgi:hypothetical protein